jgi:hypothetical protein
MRLDDMACIDFEGIEARREPTRLRTERLVEHIAQAMSCVC